MADLTLIAISGSLRRASWNTKCLLVAAEGAQNKGAHVDVVDASDLELPLFNEDLEAGGLPPKVLALRERMKRAHGMLIACPEYNASITPALKNAIDWASRPREGEGRLVCFAGKAAGLLAASPGKLGGIRGLPETVRILSGIGVTVSPTMFAVGEVHTKFETDGSVTDDGVRKGLHGVGAALATLAAAIRSQ